MSRSSFSTRLTLLALLSASTFYFFYKSRRLKLLKHSLNPSPNTDKGKIFFISQTGTSKTLAHRLLNLLHSQNLPFDLIDPKQYEPEDLQKENLVLIVASTWEDGNPPPDAKFLADWLAESAADFRVGSLLLSRLRFAVFGVGSRAYGEAYNAVAREFSRRLKELGGKEIVRVGEGDVDRGDLDRVFEEWSTKVVGVLEGGCGVVENGTVLGNGTDENDNESAYGGETDDEEEENGRESEVVDLEDIAGKAPSRKSSATTETNGRINGKRDMVTPVIRASLEKQVNFVILQIL